MENQKPPEFHPSFYGPRYWPTWLALGFFHVLGHLPIGLSMGIGRLVGDLFYLVAKSRRRIAETNIAKCFPELSAAGQRELVRKVMQSTGKSMIETAIALWGPEDKLRNRYSVRGLEHIEAAQARGQGIVLVACHLTTMDIAGRIMGFHFKFDMLYRKDPNPLLAFKLIQAREKYIGNAIVRSDTRQLIHNLREGHIVWYAPDQDYGARHSVFAPFFGNLAASVTGTGRICRLGKAVAIPLAHYRDDSTNRYELTFGEPLADFPTGDDLVDATRVNQVVEAAIRRQPDQYLWVHRRFKTRPPGAEDFYRR